MATGKVGRRFHAVLSGVGVIVGLGDLGSTGYVATAAADDTTQWALTEPPRPGQLQGSVSFFYATASSDIYREHIGGDGSLSTPLPTGHEFTAERVTQTFVPRVTFGLPSDFWLTVALPITLTDRRTLSRPAGQSTTDNTTIADGFVGADGFDASTAGAIGSGDNAFFRGVDRGGLDQLEVGLGWVPMSQRQDSNTPTWTIAIDLLLPVGESAQFVRNNPSENTSVGTGTHDLRFRTAVHQRYGAFTPYWQLWWQAPLGNRSDSLFEAPGFGARNSQKQQVAGLDFGVVAGIAPRRQQRYELELGGSIISHFEGRGYSEMWELLAYAGDAQASAPLVLDADPTTAGVQAKSHPGVTYIENYLELQGTAAVHATINDHLALGVRGRLSRSTNHFITFADAGVDLPTCQEGGTGCEGGNNTVVTPNTEEVNPAYNSQIDLIGHRYRAESNTGVSLFIEARGTF